MRVSRRGAGGGCAGTARHSAHPAAAAAAPRRSAPTTIAITAPRTQH